MNIFPVSDKAQRLCLMFLTSLLSFIQLIINFLLKWPNCPEIGQLKKNNWKSDCWLIICHWWILKMFLFYTSKISLNMASNKQKHQLGWLWLFYLFTLLYPSHIKISMTDLPDSFNSQICVSIVVEVFIILDIINLTKCIFSYWQQPAFKLPRFSRIY